MSVLRLTGLFTTIPPGGFSPPGAPLENIEIRAVNRSAAQSPWNAIKRAPGVGSHSPSKASMRGPRWRLRREFRSQTIDYIAVTLRTFIASAGISFSRR
jgi:hypothetical protein